MSAEQRSDPAADVLVDRRPGGVVWVTLNRPDARNALSRAVNLRLFALAEELDADPDVRAVVVTGAGDQAFCAGADLKERKGVPASEAGPFIDAISGAINRWAKLRCATFAAMNGSAFGGGLELALACDFRIIVDGAQVGLTEVRLGIMPGAGGTQRLPRLIGMARAKELIMLGQRISATKALEYGLVNRVTEPKDFLPLVDGMLAELRRCAPLSVRQAKAALELGMDGDLDGGLAIERRCYDVTLASEDRDEGLRAFAEGRAPTFSGR